MAEDREDINVGGVGEKVRSYEWLRGEIAKGEFDVV